MATGTFKLPAGGAGTTDTPEVGVNPTYVEPSDWIDITSVADNEINLLVQESQALSFAITTASGTYSIDWGDGIIQTSRTSTTTYQHLHTSYPITLQGTEDTITKTSHGIANGTKVSLAALVATTGIVINTQYYVVNTATDTFQVALTLGGSPIDLVSDGTGTLIIGGKWCSEGYFTWFVRIYGASGNITLFALKAQTLFPTTDNYYPGLLSCFMGTRYISTFANMFYSIGILYCYQLRRFYLSGIESSNYGSFMSMFLNCTALEKVVLPSTTGNYRYADSMFSGCSKLIDVTLFTSWGLIIGAGSMFNACTALRTVNIPSTWGTMSDGVSRMFAGCSSLVSITLPTSWSANMGVGCDNMFYLCKVLKNVTLPTSWSALQGSVSDMFNRCYSLNNITIPSSFVGCTGVTYMFNECYSLRTISDITSWGSATNTTYMFTNCYSLKSITIPTSWGSVTNTSYMFRGCNSLESIILPASFINTTTTVVYMFGDCINLKSITMPTSWGTGSLTAAYFLYSTSVSNVVMPSSCGNVTSFAGFFYNCAILSNVTMPTSFSDVNCSLNSMFYGCYGLKSITLPSSWSKTTDAGSMFYNCRSLISVILPSSISTTMAIASSMFYACNSIRKITNLDFVGSSSQQCDMNSIIPSQDTAFSQDVVIDSMLSIIAIYGGNAGSKLPIASIRLTRAGSLFTGASPQINISYTSLPVSALEILFGDIPNGLSAKTIAITGATGTDAMITKASSVTTSGSTTITIPNKTSLVAGMECYNAGAALGISSARAVTVQTGVNTVTRTAHGIPNDKMISFTTTANGITLNTIYYVINTATDTFQISTTSGGSAVTITTNGAMSATVIPVIVTVNTLNVVLDVPCSASGTVSLVSGVLKRSIALLKGWTITN